MKVTDETPLFYRVVLKNAKGVIHVQDCDFQPTEDDYDGEVLSVTPLYAHSQPKREPLSDEKCWELIHSLSTPNGQHSLLQLVRWVEKAHGIGGE